MEQTAVEWLVEQIKKDINVRLRGFDIDKALEQAKKMEKQRMIDFSKYCLNNAKYLNFEKALFNVEEYYQIFKSE